MDKKILLIGAFVALAIVSLIVGAVAFPRIVTETKTEIQTVTQTVEVIKEVPVEKIVEVDNGNLALVLESLVNKGIYDEEDDIVANIQFENSVVSQAIAEIELNGFEEFDDSDFRGNFSDFSDKEISVNKIESDFEDINFVDIDYDDKEAEVEIEVEMKGKDGADVLKISYIFTVFVDDEGASIEDIELA